MVKLNDPVFATIGELSAYSQKPVDLDNDEQVAQFKASLCAAELSVAAELDADTLLEHQVTVTTKLARPKPSIEIDDGPITTIQSVTVADTVLDPTTVEILSHWAIFRNDILFPENTTIILDYLSGYRVESDGTTTLPRRIRQAILEVATVRNAAPDTGLIRERIGDWAGERADPGAGGEIAPIPSSVKALLAAYRRPLY